MPPRFDRGVIMSNRAKRASRPAGKRVRVGYLLKMYPRFSQTFVVNEILELERQGLDVSIVSLRKPNEGVFHECITRVKARAHYLPGSMLAGVRGHLRTHWRLVRRSPANYMATLWLICSRKGIRWREFLQAGHLLRWVRGRRVKHVHVHFGTDEASVAMLAHMAGGLSYSMTLHAFDIFRANVDKALLARKINASRFTVTVCESNRRYILENVPGVDPAKVRVNYNGIDLNRFSVGEADRQERSIFTVGRLIEKKGFIHLIRALGLLRQEGLKVNCAIAGEGRDEKKLKREIRHLGLRSRVRLLGPIRQRRVQEFLHRSAAFVLPCVQAKDGNIDALPTVLLESLACGCPTITTRLSGNPEIVEDGVSGLLVETGDVKDLAAAIRRILTDRPFAAQLAVAGRRRAEERFDVERNVAVMHGWLREAAASRRQAKAQRESAANVDAKSAVYEAA